MSHVTCLNNTRIWFYESPCNEFAGVQDDPAWCASEHAPGMPTACLLGKNNLWLTNHTQELQGTSRDTAAILATAAATTMEEISPNWFGVWKILKVPQVWTKFGYKQV